MSSEHFGAGAAAGAHLDGSAARAQPLLLRESLLHPGGARGRRAELR